MGRSTTFRFLNPFKIRRYFPEIEVPLAIFLGYTQILLCQVKKAKYLLEPRSAVFTRRLPGDCDHSTPGGGGGAHYSTDHARRFYSFLLVVSCSTPHLNGNVMQDPRLLVENSTRADGAAPEHRDHRKNQIRRTMFYRHEETPAPVSHNSSSNIVLYIAGKNIHSK